MYLYQKRQARIEIMNSHFRNVNSGNLFWVLMLLILVIAAGGCAGIAVPQGWSGGLINQDKDTIYVGTAQGEMKAINILEGDSRTSQYDLGPGEQLWTFNLKDMGHNAEQTDRATIYGTPVIFEDRLYVGGYDGYVYVLTLDGELLLEERIGDGDHIVGGPYVAGGNLLIGSSDGNLYALSSEDLTEKWVFSTGNKVWSTPVVDNGIVYFGSQDHVFYAINLNTGNKIWDFRVGGAITSTAVLFDGRVYIGSFDGIFYSIDGLTGKEISRFEGGKGWYWGTPITDGETIFIPSLNGSLYALSLDSLNPVWERPLETEGPIIGSPVIVGDFIAVPSRDEGVYLARLLDGRFEDRCDIDSPLRASLSAVGNTIYFPVGNSVRQLFVNPTGNFKGGWLHATDFESNQDDSRLTVERWRCG